MMADIPVDDDVRLKRLYVLLGRIGGLDKYVWDNMNHEEQVKSFHVEYEILFEADETSGNTREDRFTSESVLKGTITAKEKAFATKKKLSGASEIKEETLLHRAISLINYKDDQSDHALNEIIKKLIQNLPFLLKCDRSGSEYDGESPLHLAVLKENVKLVKSIAKAMKKKENNFSLDPVALGSKFDRTVMMAGTPLCVAALTLKQKIFKILVDEGADIAGKNKDGENMCHSLVRYAHYSPDKLDKICEMLEFILKCKWKKGREIIPETQKLLMLGNKDGLNPLQLATKFRLHKIFKQLFGYEAYCKPNLRDSLRDDQSYDVTEIDTVPVHISAEDSRTNKSKEGHVSLLPTILLQSPQSAIQFLEFPPIRQVIEQKWNRYRWYVLALGIFHVVFMILLFYAAFRRANLTNDPTANPNETLSDRPNFTEKVPTEPFVTGVCIMGFIIGIIYMYIGLQITSYFRGYNQNTLKSNGIWKPLKYPHSNIIHKYMFVLFSLGLISDFLLAVSQVDTYENWALIAAVIIGSYLSLFFLQMIKYFSFFTALIQVAMVDLARFAFVMSIFLLAFSMAMYMIMQGADSEDDTFRSYGSTLMKMFNVMLGLGDIDTLFHARHPAAAIVVFVVFVLLTTMLLLNALLAIMANTCSNLLSQYGDVTAYKLHYRLHKLSTILFIENILPQKYQKGVGEIKEQKRFKGAKWYTNVKRRMLDHSSLTTKYEKDQEDLSSVKGLLNYFRGSSSKSKGKKKNGSKIVPRVIRYLAPTTVDVKTMTPVDQPAFVNRE